MFFYFGAVVIVFFQLVYPLFLIYRLWHTRFIEKREWLIKVLTLVLVLACMFYIGRWDIIGSGLRYWLYPIYLLAAGLSFVTIRKLPINSDQKSKISWGTLIDPILAFAFLLWIFSGFTYGQNYTTITYPLKGKNINVVQGGSSGIINYHGLFAEPQTYALDMNRLDSGGQRADGFYPSDPKAYEVFGDTVYSPVNGTVVKQQDHLPDLQPPETSDRSATGNHIWIRNDSLYFVLAHLKQHSVIVSAGKKVSAGRPLAQVGNTGNTSEPHLHLHAVYYPESKTPPIDSLLYSGIPVPLVLEGDFLIRNEKYDVPYEWK